MSGSGRRIRTTLLGIVVAILGLGALKLSMPVSMPLFAGLFLVALTWPLLRVLIPRIGRWPATLIAFLVVLAVAAVLAGGTWLVSRQVGDVITEYAPRWNDMLGQLQGMASSVGLPVEDATPSANTLEKVGTSAVGTTTNTLSRAALAAGFLVLGLIEVSRNQNTLFGNEAVGAATTEMVNDLTDQLQRYLWARCAISAVTGILTGLGVWAIGLEMPFVWGFLAFLLNFVPNVGPVVVVSAATLFGAAQFQSVGWTLGTLAITGGIQITLGVLADPLVQGRVLKVSPVAVLFAVVFWGWMWGIPGAFMGVPMTVVIIVIAHHFPRTRWIAGLLSGGQLAPLDGQRIAEDREDDAEPADAEPADAEPADAEPADADTEAEGASRVA